MAAVAAAGMAVVFASSCSFDRVVNMVNTNGLTPQGAMTERTYEFGDIKSIETEAGIYVYYTCGERVEPVRVEGPEDVLEVLEVKCGRDGELELSFSGSKRFSYRSKEEHVHVYVTAPAVSGFEASSGGQIEAEGVVTVAGKLSADVSSGAYISFGGIRASEVELGASSGGTLEASDVVADDVEAEASSGAHIEVAGSAYSAQLKASSGGSVSAGKLEAERGKAKASSGGSVRSAIAVAEVERSSGGSVNNKPGK